jgi:xanthine dehydrogenase accessory factor
MDYALTELCRFFAVARPRQSPLVLATVLRTEGSTYRKAGAAILIGPDGSSSGMLSGGCLEAGLRERAARVLARNQAERIWIDTREDDDPVFGLGMGCEGAMDIWLQPVAPADGDGPLHYLHRCLESETPGTIVTVVGGQAAPAELGRQAYAQMAGPAGGPAPCDGDALDVALAALARSGANGGHAAQLRTIQLQGRMIEVFVAPVELPPSVLLCGAGPDAIPVYRFAAALGWRVTVFDHRPAYAARELYPEATRVLIGRAEVLRDHLDPSKFDAAVVMSHHLPSDILYLKLLCAAPPRYIGLLGPPARRQRLLAEAGDAAIRTASRIHGPVGLDIGAGTPASIALAIVAHIHAVLAGRPGGPF